MPRLNGRDEREPGQVDGVGVGQPERLGLDFVALGDEGGAKPQRQADLGGRLQLRHAGQSPARCAVQLDAQPARRGQPMSPRRRDSAASCSPYHTLRRLATVIRDPLLILDSAGPHRRPVPRVVPGVS